MTTLVTGGAGYIGSHMVYRLVDAGEPVIVLDNLSTGFDWLVAPDVDLVVGDVGDMQLVADLIRAHKVTAIIHFAGSAVVPESVENPLKYYVNNTVNTRALIETAVAGEVQHFIFSSTAAVYGITGLDPVREDAPLAPISPYGRSKMMSEMMLADVAAVTPLRFGILRYFNVAGADPEGRTGQATARATHLIKVACQTALGLRPHMEIFGTDYPTPDGTGLRDFIHVTDLVDAHAALLAYLRDGGESVTLNCGYGTGHSVSDVVAVVRAVSGVDLEARPMPRRPGDAASVIAAADRIHQVLDWQPAYRDLTQIVRSAYIWEEHLGARMDRPAVA